LGSVNGEAIIDRVPKRILTVEDDDGIRTTLKLALEGAGYEVVEAPSAEGGVESMADHGVDAILVDLMLPGASGLDFVRSVRQTSGVPIIIVTARTDSHDVVAGMEAGADDYVRKPFVIKELEARLRALLRRSGDGAAAAHPSPRALEFGEFELAPEAGTIARNGEPVALTRTEFRLLCELIGACGATTTSVTCAWSTPISGASEPRSNPIPRHRRSSSRSVASGTSSCGEGS
jgi:DNA-binding response OmpR family regulator